MLDQAASRWRMSWGIPALGYLNSPLDEWLVARRIALTNEICRVGILPVASFGAFTAACDCVCDKVAGSLALKILVGFTSVALLGGAVATAVLLPPLLPLWSALALAAIAGAVGLALATILIAASVGFGTADGKRQKFVANVTKMFLAEGKGNGPHGENKRCFGKILLGNYSPHDGFSADIERLRKLYQFIDGNYEYDAFMLHILSWALCTPGKCMDEPNVSCSKYACDLLVKLDKYERLALFKENRDMEATIISNFGSQQHRNNCLNFLDFLKKTDKDECRDWLLAADGIGKAIADHMQEIDDGELHKKYDDLIEQFELDTGSNFFASQFRPWHNTSDCPPYHIMRVGELWPRPGGADF